MKYFHMYNYTIMKLKNYGNIYFAFKTGDVDVKGKITILYSQTTSSALFFFVYAQRIKTIFCKVNCNKELVQRMDNLLKWSRTSV